MALNHATALRMDDPFTTPQGISFVPTGFEEGHEREQFWRGALNPPAQRKIKHRAPYRAMAPDVKTEEFTPGLSAQIFIGLSVDGNAEWTPDQIRDDLMEYREEQFARLEKDEKRELYGRGLSVVPSLGYWRKTARTGQAYPEESVSVHLLNVSGETEKEFIAHIDEIARWAIQQFYQDAVIVQILRANVVEKLFGYTGEIVK